MTMPSTVAMTTLFAAGAIAAAGALPCGHSFELTTPLVPLGHRYHHITSSSTSPSSTPILTVHQQFKRRRRVSFVLSSITGERARSDHVNTTKTPKVTVKSTVNDRLFQNRLDELGHFRSLHGHGSIPTPYPPNPPLGIWAANLRRQHILQRRAEERGIPYVGYLTAERRQRLLAAGFDFTTLTERQFQTRLEELRQFRERYGHCLVPERWDENPTLGAWVSNLRSLYKRRARRIRLQQQRDGESDVDSNDDNQPNSGRRNARGKNILLQSPSQPRPKRQRSPRFSHLDDDRIQLLEGMGFVWSSTDRKWLEMLEWAKVYGVVNHHLNLAGGAGVGYGAGIDNSTLVLDSYRNFALGIQDQSVLTTFQHQDEVWALLSGETRKESLGQQQQEQQQAETTISSQCNNGTFPLDYRIPPNDTLHQPLRIWMINQRSNYNRLQHTSEQPQLENTSLIQSTMTRQRQQALEEIHFPWSGRFRNRIEEVQYEAERRAEVERQREKERRREQREREERERVKRLTSSREVAVEMMEMDVMALWDAGDDDEDDDW